MIPALTDRLDIFSLQFVFYLMACYSKNIKFLIEGIDDTYG